MNTGQTVNLNANQSALGLTLNSSGLTTLLGGGTNRILTLGSGGVVLGASSGGAAFNTSSGQRVRINLSADQTWTNNSSSNFVKSGTGNTNALDIGAFQLELNTAGSGYLQFANNILGTADSSIVVNSAVAGVVRFSGDNINFLGDLILNTGTVFVFGHGNALGGGTFQINGGALQQGNSTPQTYVTDVVVGGDFGLTGADDAGELAGTVDLGGATRTVTTNANWAISGEISNGDLAKAGGSTLTLSGTNIYGDTFIEEGVISVASIDDNLGAGTVHIGSGATDGTLLYTGAGETVTKTLDLAGTTGGAVINNAGSGALVISNDITATGAGSKTLTLTGSNINEISGAIQDNSGANTTALAITGGQWILSGNNTYTGGTAVSAGAVRTGNDSAFGTGDVTFSGSGSWAAGGDTTIANDIILDANTNGNALSGTTEFTGQISGTGDFRFNGFTGGTVKLSGDNSGWSGNLTFFGQPTVQLNHVNALGAGTTITFNTPGSDDTERGTLESQVDLTGANAVAKSVNLGDASGFFNNVAYINTTADMEMTGVVSGAADALFVKEGAGVLTFSGDNTYLGTTTVTAGTLLVNGDSSGATGAVSVASGATLGGSGTVGGATTISGIHAPGTSPGTQTFDAGLTYNTASTLQWELVANSDASRGTNFDGINVDGGALTIQTGVTSSLIFNGVGSAVDWTLAFWDTDQSWLVFDNANSPTLDSGSIFDTISVGVDINGAVLTSVRSGASFSWSQSGNDVLLNYTAVPEPSTWALLTGSLLLVTVFRRRRVS